MKLDEKLLNDSRYDYFYTLECGDRVYDLDLEDSKRVLVAVDSGSRATIKIKNDYANLVYLRNFYCRERKLKPEFVLDDPEKTEIDVFADEDPEVREMRLKRNAEIRSKIKILSNSKRMP